MRRWLLPALMMILLLGGCGDAAQEREMEAMKAALAAAEEIRAEADITANLGDERFQCSVVCRATAEQTGIELTAPESIAGIRAVVSEDGMSIEYADVSLGLGSPGTDVAPVTALPILLTALKRGGALRSWTERDAERTMIVREQYVTDETTLTVWLDASSLLPVHAEFLQNGEVTLRCEIRDFSYR